MLESAWSTARALDAKPLVTDIEDLAHRAWIALDERELVEPEAPR